MGNALSFQAVVGTAIGYIEGECWEDDIGAASAANFCNYPGYEPFKNHHVVGIEFGILPSRTQLVRPARFYAFSR
jgi:hypothetical protein